MLDSVHVLFLVEPTKPAKAGDKRKAETKPSAIVAPTQVKKPKMSAAEFSEFVKGMFIVQNTLFSKQCILKHI